MKMRLMMCAVLVAAFVSGASKMAIGQQVSVNYDHGQDFSQFHTRVCSGHY